jgi:hypothetical protein
MQSCDPEKGKHFRQEEIQNVMMVKNVQTIYNKTKLHGFSPQANYTDRVTAACRRS